MKIIQAQVNVQTGEETITEREETDAEKKEREAKIKEILAKQTEVEAKAAAKAALLSKLGITAEEAQLLLS